MADSINLEMNIKFIHPPTVFCLQLGGWLPPAFMSADVVLVDRNITSLLPSIDSLSNRKDIEGNKWWFSFLNTPKTKLNPILCAFEGRNGKVPNFDEFCTELNRLSKLMEASFPDAEIIKFDSKSLPQAYQLVHDLNDRYNREQSFLMSIAPLICNTPPKSKLLEIEQKILSSAQSNSLPNCSLTFIAALSCLYEAPSSKKEQAGRKILKPTLNYTSKAAHNAISDLRALELIMCSDGMGLGSPAFCTRDRYLAYFWCSIQPSKRIQSAAPGKLSITIKSNLFPRLNEEQLKKLEERIKEQQSN